MARRVFFDWNRPPIKQAGEWLVREYVQGSCVDLSSVAVVIPTAIARRSLIECLVDECVLHSRSLLLPEIITLRHLPELLYDNERPFANELTSRLAWQRAIATLAPDDVRAFAPKFDGDTRQLMALASLIQSVHQDLAAAALSCSSVRKRLEGRASSDEIRRWQALEKVQKNYYHFLTELGYWDQQAARNVAIHRNQCRLNQPLILIGTADLNTAMRNMLSQVGASVTALIFASPDDTEGFDDVGGLLIEYWAQRPVAVRDDQIVIVDRPHDQSLAVLTTMAQWQQEGDTAPVLGVPDSGLLPVLERTLEWHGFQTYWPGGTAVRESLPWQLMRQAAEFVDRPTFERFAVLVRHPDGFDYVSRRTKSKSWLHLVDEFQNQELPAHIGSPSSEELQRPASDDIDFHRIRREVFRLLHPIARKRQTLTDWGRAFAGLMDQAYAGRRWPDEEVAARRLAAALDVLSSAFADVAELDERLSETMTATEFVQTLDALYGDEPLMDQRDLAALEFAGWLDLPWMTVDSMVITSVNDDILPSTAIGHPFLPDSLCQELDIENNQRRLARDVYAMNLLAHSRRRIRCVVGRRDGEGNPLKPSRLLLATDDDALVRRAQAFFTFAGTSRPRPWLTPTAAGDAPSGFQVPEPRDIQDLRMVSVTMFRDYLACPYRFYLKHVLRLGSVCDDLEELGGDQFGSLAHQVLQAFGESDLRGSGDPHEIAEYLSAVLNAQPQVADLDSKLPTVRIQLESLRRRLKQFAHVQAERRQQGWQIVAVEQKLDVPWTVDGEPFVIRGRIDRIDQHDDGRWAVWDYKSSERAKSPKAAHRRRNEWIDLQLPLYRHLLTVWRPDVEPHRDSIVTGYISIPSLLRHIKFDAAEWTPDELREADAVAESVLRDLKANRFWPPNSQPPDFSDDFAAICQDNIFGREATI